LTVSARVSTALARKLTYVETEQVIDAAIHRATGDGQNANTAARVLLDFVRVAGLGEEADTTEGVRYRT
jgi:hypothetical protein